jgi:hypothetical protein
MSEVERHNLFSRFKKHEKREIQEEQSAVKIRTSEEITAENIDHLHSLQKQFALLDLDPFISRLQGDIDAITKSMETYEGIKNEIGLDVWKFNLAVPGKWFDQDTAVRAATGMAFQLYYERPDMAIPQIDGYYYGIGSTVPFFSTRNPTFIVMLYSPTQQAVSPDGEELINVAPNQLLITTDHEDSNYHGKLLHGTSVAISAAAKYKARLDHAKQESRRFSHEAIIAAKQNFEGIKPWVEKPFVWDQVINGFNNKSQIESLNDVFGIRIEKSRPRFRRKINTEIIKGSGRERSETFFPSNAGVIRNQIDQNVWEFLRKQPMYTPYLESPFSEENK